MVVRCTNGATAPLAWGRAFALRAALCPAGHSGPPAQLGVADCRRVGAAGASVPGRRMRLRLARTALLWRTVAAKRRRQSGDADLLAGYGGCYFAGRAGFGPAGHAGKPVVASHLRRAGLGMGAVVFPSCTPIAFARMAVGGRRFSCGCSRRVFSGRCH